MLYIVPELLEEIFLALPLKSILKFKTVSKQWRSILESKLFVERRMNVQNNNRRKILAVGGDRNESGFESDEEIDMVYLNHCDDDATRPSLTCEGLVCIPEPGRINVLNPSIRQLRRFPCTPDHPVPSFILERQLRDKPYLTFFPGNWAMGFGRDKVTDCYKVVRMCFFPVEECEVLDLETGEWRKLNPPPHRVDVGRKSVCVNGSIYWLYTFWCFNLLALDLHTLEFRNVSVPGTWFNWEIHMVNLEGRLAIAKTKKAPEWELEILSMIDSQGDIWSKTHSIKLASIIINNHPCWFTLVTVSKLGNLVFYDNHKRLFKYHPAKDEICCLSSNISVISPYVENLVPLPGSGPNPEDWTSTCGLFSKQPELGRINFRFLFTTLVVVGYYYFR
ncbi:PREDICTED: F-box/kelch-repeat protein At2g43270-like [Camelina sativa]|uniref:F-box/kelch-repeat protein At2g43270-like n=1 Tax=Camelina sativa TaxID=90675 RepID=A0ABM0YRD7_CAMSA|nr:PREDICTED: F-box/kelch-repeat protein At2g43270-like [Camelina sativa]